MPLQESLAESGSWLFRYRSYVPIVLVPLFAARILSFTYLQGSHAVTELWQLVCLLVSLAGLGVRVASVGHAPRGTSGRNASAQRATVLNVTGLYSIVRHPLYLGNYLILLGFSLFFHSAWFALLITCLFAVYYERIMLAEEAFLRERFGAAFESWAASTPAFIPRLSLWKRPDLPYCWRTVLRREHTGLLLIAIIFAMLDEVGDSYVEDRWITDVRWLTLLAVAAASYLLLRTLKKHTLLLNVEGR